MFALTRASLKSRTVASAESAPPLYYLFERLDYASHTIIGAQYIKQTQKNLEFRPRAVVSWTGVLSGQWSSGAACLPGVF